VAEELAEPVTLPASVEAALVAREALLGVARIEGKGLRKGIKDWWYRDEWMGGWVGG
jgi:hypothetical protein